MPNVFVAPAGWSWDIVLYFFVGGIAAGAYFVASLLRLVGRPEDRPISRLGYYLAFPLITIGLLLLVKDLGRPERFWHMVFASEEFPALMFKWWSPISFGTWIVSIFALLALFSLVHALLEGGVTRASGVRRFTRAFHEPGRWLAAGFLAFGALWSLILGGYTGMLLHVTNAPTWGHDPLLPPMFMASAIATGAATVYLLAWATGAGDSLGRLKVLRTGAMALAFEIVLVLAAVLLSIGHIAPFFMGWWAALFWLVILPFGLVLPLAILLLAGFRNRHLVRNAPVVGAALLLFGGIMMRLLEVLGGQYYFVPY